MSKKAMAIVCILAGVLLEFAFAIAWTQGIDQQGAPFKYGGMAVMALGLVLFFAGVVLIGKARQEQEDKEREARQTNPPDR